MARDSPVVTVVVVTHRAAGFVGACLGGLAAQTVPHRLLVVDNASQDGTADVLAELIRPDERLRSVRRLAANEGFAGGVAAALPLVDTPFVALLNDDAVPAPDWIGRCWPSRCSTRSVRPGRRWWRCGTTRRW